MSDRAADNQTGTSDTESALGGTLAEAAAVHRREWMAWATPCIADYIQPGAAGPRSRDEQALQARLNRTLNEAFWLVADPSEDAPLDPGQVAERIYEHEPARQLLEAARGMTIETAVDETDVETQMLITRLMDERNGTACAAASSAQETEALETGSKDTYASRARRGAGRVSPYDNSANRDLHLYPFSQRAREEAERCARQFWLESMTPVKPSQEPAPVITDDTDEALRVMLRLRALRPTLIGAGTAVARHRWCIFRGNQLLPSVAAEITDEQEDEYIINIRVTGLPYDVTPDELHIRLRELNLDVRQDWTVLANSH